MAEKSFPIVNTPLSDDEWKTIALGMPQGIIDMGGWPYGLKSRNNVDNTVTIGVDSLTERNEALLQGFVHRIDHEKVLDLPAVTTTTTYEIGLVYDPLAHSSTGGPVQLAVWTHPADYTGGKARLVLYRIIRNPNQLLTDATVQEYRQRVAPVMVVSAVSHLPKVETMLTDTLAFVRSDASWHRVANNGTDPMSWVKISSGLPEYGTGVAANTLAQRDGAGRLRAAAAGSGSTDVITRETFGNPTHLNEPGELVRRWSGTGTFHAPTPAAASDVANKGYVDGRVDGHNHGAGDITSGTLSRHRVDGSIPAWNYTVGGTYSTLAVQSDGRFGKWSSTRRRKTNDELFDRDPRELLGPSARRYQRLNPDGTVNPHWELGVFAEDFTEVLPELVEWGPDSIDEDGNPTTEDKVQGFTYMTWTAVHQYLLQWLTERVDEADKRADEAEARANRLQVGLEALAQHVGFDVAPYLTPEA